MEASSSSGSPTAARIERHLTRQQARVWKYLKQRGRDGATDKEMQQALNMRGDSQRPRRRELERLGYVREAIFYRRGQRVWMAIESAVTPPTPTPPVDQVSSRRTTQLQIEADRAELDRLNAVWGERLDSLTDEELAVLIAHVASLESRESLRRRLEKLGVRNTFVRRPLLRLLSSTRVD